MGTACHRLRRSGRSRVPLLQLRRRDAGAAVKIVSTTIEPCRGSQASVEFVIRVTLDGTASSCKVSGRVIGPQATGFTTVEVAYALVSVEASDNTVSLKCVIPEPTLWTRESPFGYTWSVEVRVNGELTDSRAGSLAFPAAK
ncbi:MAG: hypothetical protein C0467_19530 [Planctomycetaceae bacterium]|nr:hypothetical protein [Planctomycetaceae bacterium]